MWNGQYTINYGKNMDTGVSKTSLVNIVNYSLDYSFLSSNTIMLIVLVTLDIYSCQHHTQLSSTCYKIKSLWNSISYATLTWPSHHFLIVSTVGGTLSCTNCKARHVVAKNAKIYTLITSFMGQTWGLPGADRTQVGHVNLALWVDFLEYILLTKHYSN